MRTRDNNIITYIGYTMMYTIGSQASNTCESKSSVTELEQTSSDFQQNFLLSTKSSSSMLLSFKPRLCASSILFNAKQPSFESVSAAPNVPSVSCKSLPSAVAKVSHKRKASFKHNNDEDRNWPRPVASWEVCVVFENM